MNEQVIADLRREIQLAHTTEMRGRVVSVRGPIVRVALPVVRVGELVEIGRPGEAILAEVVGFDESIALVTPFASRRGISSNDPVRARQDALRIACSDSMLGHVFDGLGMRIDGPQETVGTRLLVERAAFESESRAAVTRVLPTGIRAIDALTTLGHGQRIALIAPPGAGKSQLLRQIARQADVDVVVFGLVGERGREAHELRTEAFDDAVRKKLCLVISTSDDPAIVRARSASVATSIAEYFRVTGRRVLLIIDSLSRVARAWREMGLAAGEPPVRRGYTPSVFAALPRLIERAGASDRGSITAIYSVLVESEIDDPIVEEVRATVDGHIVLDHARAERGLFPACDPVQSLSRVMNGLVAKPHGSAAAKVRAWMGAMASRAHLIQAGAWRSGTDPLVDEALGKLPAIDRFLQQSQSECVPLADSVRSLDRLARGD